MKRHKSLWTEITFGLSSNKQSKPVLHSYFLIQHVVFLVTFPYLPYFYLLSAVSHNTRHIYLMHIFHSNNSITTHFIAMELPWTIPSLSIHSHYGRRIFHVQSSTLEFLEYLHLNLNSKNHFFSLATYSLSSAGDPPKIKSQLLIKSNE